MAKWAFRDEVSRGGGPEPIGQSLGSNPRSSPRSLHDRTTRHARWPLGDRSGRHSPWVGGRRLTAMGPVQQIALVVEAPRVNPAPGMDVTDVLAAYAAVVATATAVWQVYVWRHGRSLRLRVHGYVHFESEEDGKDVPGLPDGPTDQQKRLSDQPIEVSASNPDKKPAGWHSGLERRAALAAHLGSLSRRP